VKHAHQNVCSNDPETDILMKEAQKDQMFVPVEKITIRFESRTYPYEEADKYGN
jgi:hypothetical protein